MTYDTIQSADILYRSGAITITGREFIIDYNRYSIQSLHSVKLISKASRLAKLLYAMVVIFSIAYEITFMLLVLPLWRYVPQNAFMEVITSAVGFAIYVAPIFALFIITNAGIKMGYYSHRLILDFESADAPVIIENPCQDFIKCLSNLSLIKVPEVKFLDIACWQIVAFFISAAAVGIGFQLVKCFST